MFPNEFVWVFFWLLTPYGCLIIFVKSAFNWLRTRSHYAVFFIAVSCWTKLNEKLCKMYENRLKLYVIMFGVSVIAIWICWCGLGHAVWERSTVQRNFSMYFWLCVWHEKSKPINLADIIACDMIITRNDHHLSGWLAHLNTHHSNLDSRPYIKCERNKFRLICPVQ